MSIKSQQDVRNAEKAKSERIPKSMEKLGGQKPTPPVKPIQPPVKELSDSERITYIEEYLKKVDAAFERIAIELESVRNFTKALHNMDAEISKITGDFVRLTKLEEERYIELATVVNQTAEKVSTLDEYLPTYINDRLGEYFEEIDTDDEKSTGDQKSEDPTTP